MVHRRTARSRDHTPVERLTWSPCQTCQTVSWAQAGWSGSCEGRREWPKCSSGPAAAEDTANFTVWNITHMAADVTAVFINNQQWREQDFDKMFVFEGVHSKEVDRWIKNAICSHFRPYLLNIVRKFEFLISQGSVATCLRWDG